MNFSGIYYPSAFIIFLPPLKNSAEKEDLPSAQFPISSVILRLHVEQHILYGTNAGQRVKKPCLMTLGRIF